MKPEIVFLCVVLALVVGWFLCYLVGRVDRKRFEEENIRLNGKLVKANGNLEVAFADLEESKELLKVSNMKIKNGSEKFDADLAVIQKKCSEKIAEKAKESKARIEALETELEHATKLNSKMTQSTGEDSTGKLAKFQERWKHTSKHWQKAIDRNVANSAKK